MRKLLLSATLIASGAFLSQAGDQGVMHFSSKALQQWTQGAAKLPVSQAPSGYPALQGAKSLLNHLHYTPAKREQGLTGTCWMWSSQAVLSMDFDIQNGGTPAIQEGFSVQFLASNAWMVGASLNSGGTILKTKEFFDMIKYDIPTDNDNAAWLDGDGNDNIPGSWINSTPNYPVTDLVATIVKTTDVDSARAIANIKSSIDNDKPVWFLYLLATEAAWDDFENFWHKQPNDTIIDLSKFKNQHSDAGAEGHAVVCVGYDDTDTDPAKHYWVILNSHGTVDGARPQGTFRLAMDMDYASQVYQGETTDSPINMFWWANLDATFASAPLAKDVKSLKVSTNSAKDNTDQIVVTDAALAQELTAVDHGYVTINKLIVPCDASTGVWTTTRKGFSFRGKGKPSITVDIDTAKGLWSAKVQKIGVSRYLDCHDGLLVRLETAPTATAELVTNGESALVFDQLTTVKDNGSFKR